MGVRTCDSRTPHSWRIVPSQPSVTLRETQPERKIEQVRNYGKRLPDRAAWPAPIIVCYTLRSRRFSG